MAGGPKPKAPAVPPPRPLKRAGLVRVVKKLLRELTWVHWAGVVGLALALLAYVGGRRFWEGVDQAEVGGRGVGYGWIVCVKWRGFDVLAFAF